MRLRLQARIFLYLAAIMLVFLVLQTLVYAYVEYRGWQEHPEEPLREEMMEVAEAVGLNLALLPAVLALAWWVSRRMLAPVREIASVAARIDRGRFGERIDTAGRPDDEMRSLCAALNAAFERYDQAVRRLDRFSGDASHQLRTPITAMRTMGEVALSRDRDPEMYRRTIEDMLGDLTRLSVIVDQLLQLSRLDGASLRGQFVPCDLGRVAGQAAQLYGPVCEEQGATLEVSVEDGLTVSGVEGLLLELAANLVDNAIRHTPRGGTIRVGALRRAGGAVLYVHDSGPGIPAAYAQRIFERFAQIPGAAHGRVGLGLALASDIAAAHGGRLSLANPGQAGARFECALPLAAEA